MSHGRPLVLLHVDEVTHLAALDPSESSHPLLVSSL